VLFVCDVPGVKADDLQVTVDNHVLTIKGARRFEGKENEQVILGRAYGTFSRSYTLPDAVDDARLEADLADGVLTVRIPKHPKAQPRRIPIGSGPTSKQLEK
jgi:HSP20 family protein